MEFIHKTVLLEEAIEYLNCQPEKIYVDATAGKGGHSLEIAKKIGTEGRLLSFDVDKDAVKAASETLKDFPNTEVINESYKNIPTVLKEKKIEKITGGILFDLGASYHQLTTQERGFSFAKEAFLDMRFNKDSDLTAYEIINKYKEQELADIFYHYGEERYSRRIAKRIVEKRKEKPIETTTELAEIVKKSVPFSKEKIHPSTRVFQALRIAVNNELEAIETTLQQIIPILDIDARIVIISFHSLEDRVVKNTFKKFSTACLCPPEQIICSCPPKQLKVLTKKPVTPSDREINENPAARSAKLRTAVRI